MESPIDKEQVAEERRERMNMRPNLEFIEENKPQYTANVQLFVDGEISDFSRKWADAIKILDNTDNKTLQITPKFARELLAHIPEGLQRVSHLKTIDYEWQHNVALPKFDDDGNFTGATLPSIQEFNASSVHKTRVLTGYTSPDGTTIKPTHIPKEVSGDPEAVRLYQTHVMLHEFFHTIEINLRSQETAQKLQLSEGRTFADWTKDFLKSMQEEKQHTSYYAGVYHDAIYDTVGDVCPTVTAHDYAIREQMAEVFVAYLLDIISNNHGYTSFQAQSFGNPQPEQELLKHGGQSKRYGLMKELCKSTPQIITDTNS